MKTPQFRQLEEHVATMNSPRAALMVGEEMLIKIVRHVDNTPGVRAIECLFLADTDGSGSIDSEEFNGAVQHMGLHMRMENSDLAFGVLCLDGKEEINIEQFISFQQRERRARDKLCAVPESPESLVARSLLALDDDQRMTVIEEMGRKQWDSAITKVETADHFNSDDDETSAAYHEKKAAHERAAADNADAAANEEELEAVEAEGIFAKEELEAREAVAACKKEQNEAAEAEIAAKRTELEAERAEMAAKKEAAEADEAKAAHAKELAEADAAVLEQQTADAAVVEAQNSVQAAHAESAPAERISELELKLSTRKATAADKAKRAAVEVREANEAEATLARESAEAAEALALAAQKRAAAAAARAAAERELREAEEAAAVADRELQEMEDAKRVAQRERAEADLAQADASTARCRAEAAAAVAQVMPWPAAAFHMKSPATATVISEGLMHRRRLRRRPSSTGGGRPSLVRYCICLVCSAAFVAEAVPFALCFRCFRG